ncbi:family 8 glycosyl transferase [Plectosphaerella plurivora]|uniref:glycogenin glucosyltransferase n=1 Tax=Plectosphaerella plurivora TaxID=936078 RepID=A0A9P8VFA5_9PEZI|nr:family 8 glycosyl transferase [Plectosphaerella plurivora]
MGSLSPNMASEGFAYFTLVTSDSYVLPAAVLARSLRNTNTTIPFCILATPSTLSKSSLATLTSISSLVVPVDPLASTSSNLCLIGRPDLHATLTKLHLWSQTSFRRILYLDADTLVLRSLDHLFTSVPSHAPFAACPELGFPDCFNSGVMLIRPDAATHEALIAFSSRAESFDGGDQGLLNMFFGDGGREAAPGPPWHRLEFAYNMEMHRVYRLYIPAAMRYREQHAVLHFIGRDKPWHFEDGKVPLGEKPAAYDEFYADMVGRWWTVKGQGQDAVDVL